MHFQFIPDDDAFHGIEIFILFILLSIIAYYV